MKKHVKQMWVAALRSGEYKQGTEQLRKGNAFCCLGVLCNLHAQMHPKIASAELSRASYLGGECFPPDQVLKWAGLDSSNPRVTIAGVDALLSEHNDGNKASGVNKRRFKTIAQAIEEQL